MKAPNFDELFRAGFSVEQLAVAFNLSLMEVRQAMTNPGLLCSACCDEIRYVHCDKPINYLAERYAADPAHVRQILSGNYRNAEADKIVEEWVQGIITLGELAKKYQCSTTTIKRVLRAKLIVEHEQVERKKYRNYRQIVVGLLNQGKTAREVARISGASLATVYSYSSLEGLSNPVSQNKLTDEQWKELLAKFQASKDISITDLAKEYGLSRTAIYKRLKKENICAITRKQK